LGPLPAIYRIAVIACALIVCIGVGAWLAAKVSDASLVGQGAWIGAGFGAVLALLLVHDVDRPSARPAPARARARHRR
jgi:hypothetical protein